MAGLGFGVLLWVFYFGFLVRLPPPFSCRSPIRGRAAPLNFALRASGGRARQGERPGLGAGGSAAAAHRWGGTDREWRWRGGCACAARPRSGVRRVRGLCPLPGSAPLRAGAAGAGRALRHSTERRDSTQHSCQREREPISIFKLHCSFFFFSFSFLIFLSRGNKTSSSLFLVPLNFFSSSLGSFPEELPEVWVYCS